MAVFIITGKLGGGKTLVSVQRIYDYLAKGRIVATNLDLRLHNLISPFNRTARVIRVPDKPTVDDLHAIGCGNESYDEELNGLLVLDECGTWFNSRSWNDKQRQPVNDWFLHARKLGWDVLLIIQDVENLDSQARRSIAEHTVFCKRTDRLAIPGLSTLFKLLTGYRLKLPKAHVARVVYGISPTDLLVDRWATRGVRLYQAYDTRQQFFTDYPYGAHSLLPPWHTHGRYMAARNWRFYMRVTRIFWKRFRSPLALGTGMLIGSSMAVAAVFATNYQPRPDPSGEYQVNQVAENRAQDPEQQKTPLGKKADKLRILGTWSSGPVYQYRLAYLRKGPEGQLQREVLTTDRLVQLGYTITPVGDCSLVINYHGHQTPVYCL